MTTPSLHIAGSGEFGVNDAKFSSDTTALPATDNTGFTDKIERADLSFGNLDLYSAFLGADFLVKSARLTVGAGSRSAI